MAAAGSMAKYQRQWHRKLAGKRHGGSHLAGWRINGGWRSWRLLAASLAAA